MATAQPLGQIAELKTFQSAAGSGSIYTVPSGRYAMVYIIGYASGASPSTLTVVNTDKIVVASGRVGIVDGSADGSSGNTSVPIEPFLMLSGQNLSITSGNAAYEINVIEYLNP